MNTLKILENILKQASKEILMNTEIDMSVQNKGFQDVVTEKDLLMERYILSELKTLFPKDHFIAEEEHQNLLTNNRTWILDPIDGTLNFSRNQPLFGIQLALYENKEAVLSVIYLPVTDEFYTAEKGKGAHLNGIKLDQVQSLTLDEAVVSLGDFSKSNPSSRPVQLKIMEELMNRAMKLRIQGASSVDFAYAASGKTNCHIIFTKRVWELAAGLLLAGEANMSVIPFESKSFEGTAYLVAANKTIAGDILDLIQKIN